MKRFHAEKTTTCHSVGRNDIFTAEGIQLARRESTTFCRLDSLPAYAVCGMTWKVKSTIVGNNAVRLLDYRQLTEFEFRFVFTL